MAQELWLVGPGPAALRPQEFFDPNRVARLEVDPRRFDDDVEASTVAFTVRLVNAFDDPVIDYGVEVVTDDPFVVTVIGPSTTTDATGRTTFFATRTGFGSTVLRITVDDQTWTVPVVFSRRVWEGHGVVEPPVTEPAPWQPVDYARLGISRLITQYRESARLRAWLVRSLALFTALEGTAWTVINQLSIDHARGVNLDVLGALVGVTRIIPRSIQLSFFGFQDTPGASPYGEEGLPHIGGRFRDESESPTATSLLADPEFRLVIKARIVKNHALGTTNDIISGASYLFDDTVPISVSDTGAMSIGIGIGRILTLVERVLISDLDLLPRPAGVQLSTRVTYNGASFFGFEDQPNAVGFSEEGQEVVQTTGAFSEEF